MFVTVERVSLSEELDVAGLAVGIVAVLLEGALVEQLEAEGAGEVLRVPLLAHCCDALAWGGGREGGGRRGEERREGGVGGRRGEERREEGVGGRSRGEERRGEERRGEEGGREEWGRGAGREGRREGKEEEEG